MPTKFTKMGLNLHFQEVKSFQKREEKNPTRYKRAFFSLFLQKNTLMFWDKNFKIIFERCSKSKKNKIN